MISIIFYNSNSVVFDVSIILIHVVLYSVTVMSDPNGIFITLVGLVPKKMKTQLNIL
jgi:hypothetical protein